MYYVEFSHTALRQAGMQPTALVVCEHQGEIREALMDAFPRTDRNVRVLHELATQGAYRVREIPLDRKAVY